MFPNFTSLAQREQKRQELLERAQRRLRQKDIKRDMFSTTLWASDSVGQQNSNVATVSNASTQTESQMPHSIPQATFTQSEPTEPKSPDVVVDEPAETEAEPKSADVQNVSEERESKRWIKQLFRSNPNWISMKIHPIKLDGSIDEKRYIGKYGNLYKYPNGIKKSTSSTIDWVKTADMIKYIHYDAESNSIDEISLMQLEDSDAWEYVNVLRKRVASEQLQGQSKYQAFPLREKDSESDTKIDETKAKAAMHFILHNYGEALKANDITPKAFLKDSSELQDARVIIDRANDLSIKNLNTDRPLRGKLRDVSWVLTLGYLMHEIEENDLGLEFNPIGNEKHISADPNRFKPSNGFWYRGQASGDDTPIYSSPKSMSTTDSKKILVDYYKLAKSENAFRIDLVPIMKNGKSDPSQRYIGWYSKGSSKGGLRAFSKLGDLYSPSNTQHLFNNIDWSETLQKLIRSIEDLQGWKDSDSVSDTDKEGIRNADALLRYILLNHGIKLIEPQTPTLAGRGLVGAGYQALQGVTRRKNQPYNLNDIQGRATSSAYTYKQIGSKYIRLPDLDSKKLCLVQPNRRKCGPMIEISDSLQLMIKDLLFKHEVNQERYDKLSIDDKKLFKEILAITHLQYDFYDRLTDPLESLKAEYDKLKGEMELGNDNPSIIKQLKSLSVDMYSNKLISDKEFKNIIVRLI